jgi:hypothetical protein
MTIKLLTALITMTLPLTLDRPAAAAPPPAAPPASLREVPFRHEGVAVSVGGGLTGYTDGATRGYLGTGGYWEVRGLLGARSFVGNEIAYVGSSRGLDGPGVDRGATMVANGLEGGMRLNLPLQLGEQVRFTPFLFGGPGFTHLRVTGTYAVGPGMSTSDTALVLTSGAGFSFTYRQLILGARFTYRQLRGADLIEIDDDAAHMQSWSTGLTLGYEL